MPTDVIVTIHHGFQQAKEIIMYLAAGATVALLIWMYAEYRRLF